TVPHCTRLGDTCHSDSDCCQGAFEVRKCKDDGTGTRRCANACTANGKRCWADDGPCCSGHCLDDETCAACVPTGQGCGRNSDCCSNHCYTDTQGKCVAPECHDDGAACTADRDCCGEMCVAGTCRANRDSCKVLSVGAQKQVGCTSTNCQTYYV